MKNEYYRTDIVLLGGGVAGLWLLNRLRKSGYHAILLESQALGKGQTILSQGIIHGGVKYALKGMKNASSEAIANMPARWEACLKGIGEIDLSQTKVLAQHQLLWTMPSWLSRVTGYFASKTLRARMEKIPPHHFPEALKHLQNKSDVYALNEPILDVSTLLKSLYQPYSQYIYHYDMLSSVASENDGVTLLVDGVTLFTNKLILTAGEGNEALLKKCGLEKPAMQRRPLHMGYAQHPALTPLYAHQLGKGKTPRITITTPDENTWYLGGEIAESGIERTKQEQCQVIRKELNKLFPHIAWEKATIRSFYINRAEPAMKNGARPSGPYVEEENNIMTAWPTKLAFAPLLADKVMERLHPPHNITADTLALSTSPVATPPWKETL